MTAASTERRDCAQFGLHDPHEWQFDGATVWCAGVPSYMDPDPAVQGHFCQASTAASTVAALYVEKDGVYFGLPGVDPWDEERDARLYEGPHPVVAHPPCNKWSPLAYINQKRIPGYHVGDDGGCFLSALNAVRTWGGVLEHPAKSLAWKRFGLTKPRRGAWSMPDEWGGVVTEVDQAAYGHRAQKTTWLYAVGQTFEINWQESPREVIVSGFTHQAKGKHVACEYRRVRPKEASRTPAAFRDVLIAMAGSAGKVTVERRG